MTKRRFWVSFSGGTPDYLIDDTEDKYNITEVIDMVMVTFPDPVRSVTIHPIPEDPRSTHGHS